MHPIAAALTATARGTFPPVDGGWERTTPWLQGVEGVVAFTGRAFLAVGPDVPDESLTGLGADGYGGASNPRLVSALAGRGWIDVLDLVLVASGTGDPGTLVPRSDLAEHPRARHAETIRGGVTTWGYAAHDVRTVVTLGRGLGGLWEVGVEMDSAGRHTGRATIAAARGLVPADDVLVAACAPGNARSVRAFLAAGFVPVASVQLWRPERAAGFPLDRAAWP
ncbi:MAG: N-acetyltransferase [Intrasporangium sp.]|uniref:N-acetyltransferase n=1 Tax=Intrasporangium sp. TaxID=1925024 RepID=UPI003F80532A